MTKNALLSTDRKGIEIWEALKKSWEICKDNEKREEFRICISQTQKKR